MFKNFRLKNFLLGWKLGKFSFVTSVIFLLNRLVLRDLFLDGLTWWNPLKGYTVLTNFLGILVLFLMSMLIASIIVSNSRVHLKLMYLHMKFLCFKDFTSPLVPSFYERCLVFFMKVITSICFYACKYKVVRYSLYFIGYLLIVWYSFTESIMPIILLWIMSSLQKYCTYVILRMFNPKKLYLDLDFIAFREYRTEYYRDSVKYMCIVEDMMKGKKIK